MNDPIPFAKALAIDPPTYKLLHLTEPLAVVQCECGRSTLVIKGFGATAACPVCGVAGCITGLTFHRQDDSGELQIAIGHAGRLVTPATVMPRNN